MLACDSPGAGPTLFALTDHACRHCGGRVLQAEGLFRCSCCTAVTAGSPDAICGCGMLSSWGTRPPPLREPKGVKKPQEVSHWQGERPFRCVRNPAQCAASPSEVVILLDGRAKEAA